MSLSQIDTPFGPLEYLYAHCLLLSSFHSTDLSWLSSDHPNSPWLNSPSPLLLPIYSKLKFYLENAIWHWLTDKISFLSCFASNKPLKDWSKHKISHQHLLISNYLFWNVPIIGFIIGWEYFQKQVTILLRNKTVIYFELIWLFIEDDDLYKVFIQNEKFVIYISDFIAIQTNKYKKLPSSSWYLILCLHFAGYHLLFIIFLEFHIRFIQCFWFIFRFLTLTLT